MRGEGGTRSHDEERFWVDDRHVEEHQSEGRFWVDDRRVEEHQSVVGSGAGIYVRSSCKGRGLKADPHSLHRY